MTTIEHHQLKGITVKNVIVTIISTASIVASVMTTYFGLKSEIQAINADRITEARLTNLRLKILENEVTLLQKEISAIKYPPGKGRSLTNNIATGEESLLTDNK